MRSRFTTALAFGIAMIGACGDAEDEAPVTERAWQVESVYDVGDGERYEVSIDETRATVDVRTAGTTTAVVVRALDDAPIVWAYSEADEVMLVDDASGDVLELDEEDPYAQLAVEAVLDGGLQAPDQFRRRGGPPGSGAPTPGGVAGRSACIKSCGSQRNDCDYRNTLLLSVAPNALMQPCDLYHQMCIDAC